MNIASLYNLFQSMIDQEVEVSVPFGVVSGVVQAVYPDYVVLQEIDGTFLLIRLDQIEVVTESVS
ncbi:MULTISPECIES: DUF2642 domain-containing protein [unclassified Geomicrobium]|uniref:DUF2642 domain-containing protein n=1 Tax=unclassified Geomicrobium TaxID=2628951 RepID=UPI00045EDBA3|nr:MULTISPECIES: DUF2642 domain-containing protein [unclassified Geomicrobium]EZH64682.1 hypothetical protein DH09_19330 [Bacillaceae bacterium JMAK1]GAJ98408.1 hypothetical protein JCM19055_1334 [Geomicrobium sp. JCM 19055]GAK08929.1 hypothetical protein JCM19038_2729 [Geomicrobium sp. JCM 19038]